MRSHLLALLGAATGLAFAGAPPTVVPPCDGPEASQFDFWVGEWDLTWPAGQGDSEGPGRGRNVITRELGRCVIHEHFSSSTSHLVGQSVSVWVAPAGEWRQTWVDNEGGYITLSGGMHDGIMELRTPMRQVRSGAWVQYRMIFRDITHDAFTWDWAVSQDSGTTWQTQWLINYHR